MKYAQIDNDTYVCYDDVNRAVSLLSKKALQDHIDSLTKAIAQVPTDGALLAWAKKNYPGLSNVTDMGNDLQNAQNQMAALQSAPKLK